MVILSRQGFAQKGENPPHGSVGIVQVRPTQGRKFEEVFESQPTAVGGLFKSGLPVGWDDGNFNFLKF